MPPLPWTQMYAPIGSSLGLSALGRVPPADRGGGAAWHLARDNEAKLFLFTLRHSIGLTIVIGLLAMLFAYVFVGAIPAA